MMRMIMSAEERAAICRNDPDFAYIWQESGLTDDTGTTGYNFRTCPCSDHNAVIKSLHNKLAIVRYALAQYDVFYLDRVVRHRDTSRKFFNFLCTELEQLYPIPDDGTQAEFQVVDAILSHTDYVLARVGMTIEHETDGDSVRWFVRRLPAA